MFRAEVEYMRVRDRIMRRNGALAGGLRWGTAPLFSGTTTTKLSSRRV
jgi:hypothetical protein